MRTNRFALAGAVSAALAVLWTAAPAASADILYLDAEGEGRPLASWYVSAYTDDCAPVWFLDNGIPISTDPVTPVTPPWDSCTGNDRNLASLGWYPTTTGTHHLVAEQRDAAGNVTSSQAQDIVVTEVPCMPRNSIICFLTGSAGSGSGTAS